MVTSSIVSGLAPTGALRAAINLGNSVLAQGDSTAPQGVSPGLARRLAAELGVPVRFTCFQMAKHSFQAVARGTADIGFMAIEPARSAEVSFTAAYVLIEGVYVVPVGSPLSSVAEVDGPGVRIGVKDGSAYDLFLTRTVQHATLVRGAEGVEVMHSHGLEAGAAVRQPGAAWVATRPEYRLIDEPFQQIEQAMATGPDRPPEAVAFLAEFVERAKADGFIREQLDLSGHPQVEVAPPGRTGRTSSGAALRAPRH